MSKNTDKILSVNKLILNNIKQPYKRGFILITSIVLISSAIIYNEIQKTYFYEKNISDNQNVIRVIVTSNQEKNLLKNITDTYSLINTKIDRKISIEKEEHKYEVYELALTDETRAKIQTILKNNDLSFIDYKNIISNIDFSYSRIFFFCNMALVFIIYIYFLSCYISLFCTINKNIINLLWQLGIEKRFLTNMIMSPLLRFQLSPIFASSIVLFAIQNQKMTMLECVMFGLYIAIFFNIFILLSLHSLIEGIVND